MMREDVTRQLLIDGLDDWVPVHALLWMVTGGERTAEAKAAVRDQLDSLFSRRLMTPGVIGDTGFEPWPPSQDWLGRALRELDEHGWDPMNEGFWLEITPIGRTAAGQGESPRRPD